MRALAVAFTLVTVALAGCLAPEEAAVVPTDNPLPPSTEPRVVIAVIDTGMNVYHEEFRRAALEPASTDVPTAQRALADVPEVAAAVPLELSLDLDWEAAVKRDMDALEQIEKGKLYTFPGTKVAGAISFFPDNWIPDGWVRVLDHPKYYTHGTMTSSRAVGNTISIAGDDPGVWIVIVQGFSPESVRWAADQPWIDIISISAGISPFSLLPAVPNVLDDGGIEAYNHAAHSKPFFASSGNGVTNAGLAGFPSWLRGSSGVPNAISVGANDNDHLSHWHNQDSYIAADGCANPSAHPGEVDEIWNGGGGTSSATPFSAGGGAKLLLEARRILGDTHVGPRVDDSLPADGGWDSLSPVDHKIVLARGEAGLVPDGPLADGVFTMKEFKDVLYHTALPTPTNDASDGVKCSVDTYPGDPWNAFGGTYVPAALVPEKARFPFQGYGEVNAASIEAGVAVLQGAGQLPARPDDDLQYMRAHHLKETAVGSGE